MTTIDYSWLVRKLPYMEVFGHFANNLWSHCAWHIALFLVWYSTHCNHLQVQLGLLIEAHEISVILDNSRCTLIPFICS